MPQGRIDDVVGRRNKQKSSAAQFLCHGKNLRAVAVIERKTGLRCKSGNQVHLRIIFRVPGTSGIKDVERDKIFRIL